MTAQHLMNCTYHTPSTSKLNLISILIARIYNVKVVLTICLCQDQDGDISLRIYDLTLDSVSVFCEFSHLSHSKKPVQQVQRVFGGKKCNSTRIEFYCNFFSSPLVNDRQPTYLTNLVKMKFHLDWVLIQLFSRKNKTMRTQPLFESHCLFQWFMVLS
jgi:hypothetical protein